MMSKKADHDLKVRTSQKKNSEYETNVHFMPNSNFYW